MQFAKRFYTISRRFFASSSSVTSNKKLSSAKKPGNTSANAQQKQVTQDISKMPQPHPVLTPLNRKSRVSSNISEPIPSIHKLPLDSISCRVELDPELQKRLPRNILEVSSHFDGNYFILRPELLNQIYLKIQTNDKIIIDGPNGSGKSVTLMQIYASFKESIKMDEKKLCLYAPNVHKWTTGYFAYYPHDSAAEFVQPELALEILRLLAICNKGKAAVEGLEKEISEAQLDAFNRAIPLYQKTFKQLSEKGIDITIFLDSVNGLIDENSLTSYLDKDGQQLPLKSLPLCAQIYQMARVKVIGAMTRSNPMLPTCISVPETITTVTVPNYNADELKCVLQLYTNLGHCSFTNKSDQFVAFKSFVSGSNGKKLFKSCEYDSIYYKP